ncbi:MAG: pyruvate formate lyase family protein [Candidatus Methanomethyliaceae archaeon]
MVFSSVVLNERQTHNINQLFKQLNSVKKYPICTERMRLITQSWKETEGEPTIIRLAKAFSYFVDHSTIYINEHENIVGHGASKYVGMELEPFWGPISEEELKKLEAEGFVEVSKELWPEIKDLAQYWKNRNLQYMIGQLLDDARLWPFAQTGVLLPPFKDKYEGIGGFAIGGIGMGVNRWIGVVDFGLVLNVGLNEIIKKAEKELSNVRFLQSEESLKKAEFLKAVIISLNAIIRLAHRYAKLAEEMASKENDPLRKKELERIAETCRWVPANPARTFYEAIQSFWFIYLVCNPSPTIGMGRFDQYMYPFYKRDKDSGRITDEEVLALLCELRIKDMELVRIALRPVKRQQQAGIAKWHNMIIGGVTPDGRDATNELTYLVLEAAKIVRTPHHTITLRVHENTPEDLMIKALEVVKLGIGMPAFIGDKSYIDFLVSLGVPLEAARDYAVGGCLDVAVPGKARLGAAPFFVVPKVLEIFLNGGTEPKTGVVVKPLNKNLTEINSFEEFLSDFKQYLAYSISRFIEGQNTLWAFHQDTFKHVVEAALMDDGIKVGKGLLERRMPYEFDATALAVGMINVADSLAAIKKLVFDDKKITLKQLKEALAANWQGYEEIRKMCLEAPKYGNDDDYVDSIAVDLYNFYADEVYKYKTINGGRWVPGGVSISSMWAGGAITGATPDGRLAGEVLADGSMSPMRGRDVNGPTAVIKSASKIPQSRFASTLMNMKFHPSALSSTEDLRKLAFLIKTYFNLGGKHVQFNVVSKETLIDAQKHPENYRDLIVRVAGYSAYFVELSKSIQDEVIKRTEHSFNS